MAKNISDEDRARARRIAKNISDEDRARRMAKNIKGLIGEGGKNISNEDRARRKAKNIEGLIAEGGKNMSDQDRALAEEQYMKRNDGGMAMSGRGKPVRTF